MSLPFVFTHWGAVTDEWLATLPAPLRPALRVDEPESFLRLVRRGLGVGVAVHSVVAGDPAAGTLVEHPVEGASGVRVSYAVRPSGRPRPGVAEWMDCLMQSREEPGYAGPRRES